MPGTKLCSRGKRHPAKSRRLKRAEGKFGRTALFPSPVHRLAPFVLWFFIYVVSFCFSPIFSHIGAFSYEVACVSDHPKGLRERRFLWDKKCQSCRVTSFSLNHIISACASGRFLWRLSSVWITQLWSKIFRSFRSRRNFLSLSFFLFPRMAIIHNSDQVLQRE